MIADAGKAVTGLAEKLHTPVVNTLLGKGAADDGQQEGEGKAKAKAKAA